MPPRRPVAARLPKPEDVSEAGLQLSALTEAARAHGEQSEPDHEIGDLHSILATCWAEMTPAQRSRVFQVHKHLAEEWS